MSSPGPTKRQIEVVGAVIVQDGKVYCAQRGMSGLLPGMWEFPGGKIEHGESEPEALAREIHEELACSVAVGERVADTVHEYDFAVIRLVTYYCTLVEGQPVLSEHMEGRWVEPSELDSLDWAPADIPAVRQIKSDLVR